MEDISGCHCCGSGQFTAVDVGSRLLAMDARSEGEDVEEGSGAGKGSSFVDCGEVSKRDQAGGVEGYAEAQRFPRFKNRWCGRGSMDKKREREIHPALKNFSFVGGVGVGKD